MPVSHRTPTRFIFTEDDLPVTAAEPWVRNKINIIRQYLHSFITNQVSKVDNLFFVDLYAGNGLYSLGSRRELFPSAALMALTLDLPISKFILCEADPERFNILKIRINKYFRHKNIVLLDGKPEEILDRIDLYVPASKGDYRASTFCLCDPFSLEMPFRLLSQLASKDFTFLVPFNFALNDQLNDTFYLTEQRHRLAEFLGSESQVQRLEKELGGNTRFYKRLIRIYESNVLTLGLNSSTSVHKLDSGLMEMPMYYIGLFSKQVPTKAVLHEVEAARHIQFDLFEG